MHDHDHDTDVGGKADESVVVEREAQQAQHHVTVWTGKALSPLSFVTTTGGHAYAALFRALFLTTIYLVCRCPVLYDGSRIS